MEKEGKLEQFITSEGIIAFVESKFIQGVGKVFAKKIYDTLGERAYRLEEVSREEILQVPGIKEKVAKSIEESLKSLPVAVSLLAFLFSCGLSYPEIKRLLANMENKQRRL